MANRRKLLLTAVTVVAACIALLGILALLNRRTQIVGYGREIQYDDFAFSVMNVTRVASIGSNGSQLPSRGAYYVVSLKVTNHARRVDYQFEDRIAVLVDETGREYHVSADGQRALEATRSTGPCTERLPAGASCVTQLVFDAPPGLGHPQLRISFGGPIGDMLDTVFSGNKRINLDPIE